MEETQLEFLEDRLEDARNHLWRAMKFGGTTQGNSTPAQLAEVRAWSTAVLAILGLIEQEKKEK